MSVTDELSVSECLRVAVKTFFGLFRIVNIKLCKHKTLIYFFIQEATLSKGDLCIAPLNDSWSRAQICTLLTSGTVGAQAK